MNSKLKTGLLLQIPNLFILILIALMAIDWSWFTLSNIVIIMLGTFYTIINIASIIYIIIGVVENGN